MASYPVSAEQDSKSLYSYVMETYGQSYVDVSATKEEIELLKAEYNVAMHSNLQVESYEAIRDYAEVLELELNAKIDDTIRNLQKSQNDVAKEIEDGLSNMSPMDLSVLNRKYNKCQEEIDDAIKDKVSILSFYETPVFKRIDTTSIEADIKDRENIINEVSDVKNTYLGRLEDLKRPFDGNVIITSPAGFRTDPITGDVRYHNATDYAIPEGTELRSVFRGVVTRSDNRGDAYGESIKIDCGNGIILHYAHLSERFVKVGDIIEQNQVIGKSGNTGRSTGPHLHLSLFYNGEALSIEELF